MESNIERLRRPCWPHANAHVERFMRTMGKLGIIAHSEGKNWKTELDRFLLDYRTTPHVTTGIAPADLLFKQQIRNRLPGSNAMIPELRRENQDKTSPTTSRLYFNAVLGRETKSRIGQIYETELKNPYFVSDIWYC